MEKTLFVDCTRGFSVDMFIASLLDGLKVNVGDFIYDWQLNLGKNVILSLDYAKSYERKGMSFKVRRRDADENNAHQHRTLKDVYKYIDECGFIKRVNLAAKGVYNVIAMAEAEAHGESPDTVHFHEVGQDRAIVSILCACDLIDSLGISNIVFSHVNTGYGKTVCAHGEVNVPAPATAAIVKKIPHFRVKELSGELLGPTGAAFIRCHATGYMPPNEFYQKMKEVKANKDNDVIFHGIGLGAKDIGMANGVICVLVVPKNDLILQKY